MSSYEEFENSFKTDAFVDQGTLKALINWKKYCYKTKKRKNYVLS